MMIRPRHVVALATAVTWTVVAGSAAQAFTMDNQSNTNSNGGPRYQDLDTKLSGSDADGGSSDHTFKSGNATFFFGPSQSGSFDQRYDTDRMFDPNGGPGRSGYR